MEELMKIVGSWLPIANMIAIMCLGWSIQQIGKYNESTESRLRGVKRVLDRQAGVIAKLMKMRKGDGK